MSALLWIRRPAASAGLIFISVAGLLLAFHGSRLVFSPDEGILLEAAQRMLGGKKLYVDFFGYMSPGSYWLQEFILHWLGLTLRAGRLGVIFDFALQSALVFWLIAAAGYPKAAWATVSLFFCFEAGNPGLILPGHRWDSAALSLASVALCVQGAVSEKRVAWLGAGALVAFAAFCTPSIALLAPVTILVLLFAGQRRFLAPYLGAAGATAACILWAMYAGGYLGAFAAQMAWLTRNYSRVNITPYGWPLGGYGELFRAISEVPLPARPILLLTALLPALLPAVALLGWAIVWFRRKIFALVPAVPSQPPAARTCIPYLLACLAVYILSTEPRPDITHLTYVAPLGYVLTAVLICEYLPRAAGLTIFACILPGALLMSAQSAAALTTTIPVSTPVGVLQVAPEEQSAVRALLGEVRPGQSLYVHPYLPLFYFLTQAGNPTRFSYLAPGMMGDNEEKAALQQLEKSPPAWILYLPLRREDYLRVFPSAAQSQLHYEAIESWIHAHYAPLDRPLWVSGYQLLTRRREPTPATAPNPPAS